MTDDKTKSERDQKYLENRQCPLCGSDDLEPQSTDYAEANVTQVMGCVNCRATWEEVYSLVGIESIKPDSLDK